MANNPDIVLNRKELTPASMLRWALFLVLVAGLAFFYLLIDFKGLSHAKGMDQAQIAREVARGNNFVTKWVRPVSLWQMNKFHKEKGEPEPLLLGMRDTYHAPLNPLLNSIFIRIFGIPSYDGVKPVYFLDSVIAGVSMVLLLGAIGVCYLLISRIFDAKIAGITAVLMLLCEMLWKFSQTGLPQMLMLFLFSFAMFFFYKAVENTQLGRGAYMWAFLTGLFFGLLAMAHWITIWVFVGLLIYTAFFMRPRGLLALVMFAIFAIIVSTWGFVNMSECGNPLGSALFQFFAGLGGETESSVMRNFDPETDPLVIQGFLRKVTSNTVAQFGNMFPYLGSIIAAPVFFLSLLHPFRRPEISQFRWAVLLMWVMAAIGMSVYGMKEGTMDPNQLNVLFIPFMTAYGLAFLSVLWSRLTIPMTHFVLREGHMIAVVLLSATPFLLSMPWDFYNGLRYSNNKSNWPPYYPLVYPQVLQKAASEKEIIATDAPWAVAWYADRTALWLPTRRDQFTKIMDSTKARGYPVSAVFLTPLSTHESFAKNISTRGSEWYDYSALIMRQSVATAFARVNPNDASQRPIIDTLDTLVDFPFKVGLPLTPAGDMVLFTERRLEEAR